MQDSQNGPHIRTAAPFSPLKESWGGPVRYSHLPIAEAAHGGCASLNTAHFREYVSHRIHSMATAWEVLHDGFGHVTLAQLPKGRHSVEEHLRLEDRRLKKSSKKVMQEKWLLLEGEGGRFSW